MDTPTSHTRRAPGEIDPEQLSIRFAPEVRQAFFDLAAAVHFSEHFDADTLRTVQEWSSTSTV